MESSAVEKNEREGDESGEEEDRRRRLGGDKGKVRRSLVQLFTLQVWSLTEIGPSNIPPPCRGG